MKDLNRLTKEELFELADESIHPGLEELIKKASKTGGWIVVFENHDFWSSNFGHRSFLAVGEEFEHKSLDAVRDKYLGNLASNREYPYHFYEVEKGDQEHVEPKDPKNGG